MIVDDRLVCSIYESPFGFGALIAGETALVAHLLPFAAGSAAAARLAAARLYPQAEGESELSRAAAALLARYFAGERLSFPLPLELSGFTSFQQQVYRTVASIGYGEVASYGEVAARCGSPNGARAVGAAMARNPLPVLIPCHRVVAGSGVMTGFTAPGGVASKRELLLMEGVRFSGAGVSREALGGRL